MQLLNKIHAKGKNGLRHAHQISIMQTMTKENL